MRATPASALAQVGACDEYPRPHEVSRMKARRRDTNRAAATAGQLAARSARYRNLTNPFEPTRIFSDDQVESLHLTALGILENQGMRVLSPRGRAAFAAAGARVDESSQMVHLDRGLVAKALATVPAQVN